MRWIGPGLLALALAGLWAADAPAGGGQAPDWESLPEVNRIWMGMEEGSVRPAHYAQVRADAEGPLELHAADREFLERGRHWATLDAEQLELERESIRVDEWKQKRQGEKAGEDAEDNRLRMVMEMREAERKIADLDTLLAEESELPEAMRRRAREAADELRERLEVLRKRADPEVLASRLEEDERELEMQLERKRRQLRLLERRARLTAEVPGELRLSDGLRRKLADPERKEGEPVWVRAGELLATVVDERKLEIVVQAAGSAISQVPETELLVLLQDGNTGGLIEGEFLRTEENDTGTEISRTHLFGIPEERLEAARQAMGHRHLVHVYRRFEQPVRLVHKKDIAFLAPEVLERAGWDGLARHLWPECRVVQVGPQTLALRPGHAN